MNADGEMSTFDGDTPLCSQQAGQSNNQIFPKGKADA
jgi:hypothetical protein